MLTPLKTYLRIKLNKPSVPRLNQKQYTVATGRSKVTLK